jgi:hypothetical protein
MTVAEMANLHLGRDAKADAVMNGLGCAGSRWVVAEW